jgi:hypothetical protein
VAEGAPDAFGEADGECDDGGTLIGGGVLDAMTPWTWAGDCAA